MKLLLKELVNPNTAILTDTQKAVLIIVHISPSPQMAYDNTSNTDNLSTARDSLVRLNALNFGDNMLSLTDVGEEMLRYHNLVDETGELTEDATNILDSLEEVSTTFKNQEIAEDFKFLASLL